MESFLYKSPFVYDKTPSRLRYYHTLDFMLNDAKVTVDCKIDTGSPVTIIGMKNRYVEYYANYIRQHGAQASNLESATRGDISRYILTVQDLRLTDEIIFPEVTISFSDDIGDKALIGMDLLTLFSFKYSLKDKLISLFYNQNYLEEIYKKQMNKDTKTIMPEMIADIDYKESHDIEELLYSNEEIKYHWLEIVKFFEGLSDDEADQYI